MKTGKGSQSCDDKESSPRRLVVERDQAKKESSPRRAPKRGFPLFMEKIMNRFIFMSASFYNAYPENIYPEIEQKMNRPYIYVATLINGVQFAVPLRSNIGHGYVLWTDKPNRCGLDFSKSIVIERNEYIDANRTPHIRQHEFDSLRGKEYIIQKKLASYIKNYKKAKSKQHIAANRELCRYSTLQYFERYL